MLLDGGYISTTKKLILKSAKIWLSILYFDWMQKFVLDISIFIYPSSLNHIMLSKSKTKYTYLCNTFGKVLWACTFIKKFSNSMLLDKLRIRWILYRHKSKQNASNALILMFKQDLCLSDFVHFVWQKSKQNN